MDRRAWQATVAESDMTEWRHATHVALCTSRQLAEWYIEFHYICVSYNSLIHSPSNGYLTYLQLYAFPNKHTHTHSRIDLCQSSATAYTQRVGVLVYMTKFLEALAENFPRELYHIRPALTGHGFPAPSAIAGTTWLSDVHLSNGRYKVLEAILVYQFSQIFAPSLFGAWGLPDPIQARA